MSDYFKLLQDVLIKPDEVYNTGSKEMWEEFEGETSIHFPDDYKELISTYGTGGIGDFLWFLTPFAEDENVNYTERADVLLEAYQTSKGNSPEYFPFNVYPEENGLLPWGYTENGDELYWKTGAAFEDWEIVVYESASPDYYSYKMSLSEFLYKIITKELECDIFPDDLFEEEVIYTAVDVE